jgi:2-oxo-4-hydroxy-4-carboxy-5-ureidoimidazoline decarboxylase
VSSRRLSITAAPRWAERLVADRPYPDLATLLGHSDEILFGLEEDQIDAALAGHPRIGERATDGDTEAAARSAREQAGMNTADQDQVAALAEANAAYEDRFGRIYLVAAAGLDAAQLLAIAQARLTNEPAAELAVVRGELAAITRTRLTEWLT